MRRRTTPRKSAPRSPKQKTNYKTRSRYPANRFPRIVANVPVGRLSRVTHALRRLALPLLSFVHEIATRPLRFLTHLPCLLRNIFRVHDLRITIGRKIPIGLTPQTLFCQSCVSLCRKPQRARFEQQRRS